MVRAKPRAGKQPAEIAAAKRSSGSRGKLAAAVREILAACAVAARKAEELRRPIQLIITVYPDQRPPTLVYREAPLSAFDGGTAGRQGAADVADILRSPDLVNSRDFALLIGATNYRINQLRRSGAVLALGGRKRGFRYPKWQIGDDGQPLPGLTEIAAELGEPWAIYRFLLHSHSELGGNTALECLKDGRVADVVELAKSHSR